MVLPARCRNGTSVEPDIYPMETVGIIQCDDRSSAELPNTGRDLV
jgi:hypothetical protein